jgi:hypothetical protein
MSIFRNFSDVQMVRGYERPREAEGMDYGDCPDEPTDGAPVVSNGAVLVPMSQQGIDGKSFLLGAVAGWIFLKMIQ